MEQELKSTIETLLDECFVLTNVIDGGGYIRLLANGVGKYQANAYQVSDIGGISAIEVLTKLKMSIGDRATKRIAQAELEVATAQDNLSKLLAAREALI
jgi:hypothetical protein